MAYQAPKGTRDVTPAESYRWQYVEELIRRTTARYGFKEIRTPVIEHTELFLRSVGDTTDVVQKEMYTFNDKGGRSITLKPEGTAGTVRMFVEHGLFAEAMPMKVYYLNCPVFRYERPQAGRLREHHQFGVECFGAPEPSADAEVISLAWDIFTAMGAKDLTVKLNSIGCPKCRDKYQAALKEYLAGHREELCEDCQVRLEKNPLRVLDCKVESCKKINAGAPHTLDYVCDECRAHMDKLRGYLDAVGIPYEMGLIKHKYVGRTFIEPVQSMRELGVKMKLSPVYSIVKGKRIVLVDDSIVRGTTSLKIVRLLREAGATEVHVRIASPMMRFTCHYGVDTSTPEELLCSHRTLEEACAAIGADSLGYLSPESTRASAFGCADPCQACFTGEYPTLLYDEEIND